LLVLSRNESQEIVIDERIVITIVRIHGNKVRVGVEAPPEMSIRRSELPPKDNSPAHFAINVYADPPAVPPTPAG
jgi:carbon storage regulator